MEVACSDRKGLEGTSVDTSPADRAVMQLFKRSENVLLLEQRQPAIGPIDMTPGTTNQRSGTPWKVSTPPPGRSVVNGNDFRPLYFSPFISLPAWANRRSRIAVAAEADGKSRGRIVHEQPEADLKRQPDAHRNARAGSSFRTAKKRRIHPQASPITAPGMSPQGRGNKAAMIAMGIEATSMQRMRLPQPGKSSVPSITTITRPSTAAPTPPTSIPILSILLYMARDVEDGIGVSSDEIEKKKGGACLSQSTAGVNPPRGFCPEFLDFSFCDSGPSIKRT